jgi:hypothetical protein
MTAANARRLHGAVRGKVSRPEGNALHTRRGEADIIDQRHALTCFKDGVKKYRA